MFVVTQILNIHKPQTKDRNNLTQSGQYSLHFCTDSIMDCLISNISFTLSFSDFIIPPFVLYTLFKMLPSQITVLSLLCIFPVFCNMMILLRLLTIKYWMRVTPDVFVWFLWHTKAHVKFLILIVTLLVLFQIINVHIF